MLRSKCEKCGKALISPIGHSKDIMLVGEFPGKEEIIQGIPFCGPTGEILKAELSRAGLPLGMCRVTNLWIHAKDEKGCDLSIHKNALAKEIEGKKYVLAMGSDVSQMLWDMAVMDLSGLKMTHPSFPGTQFYVSVNPAAVLHGPIGEFRLAVTRFAEAIHAKTR